MRGRYVDGYSMFKRGASKDDINAYEREGSTGNFKLVNHHFHCFILNFTRTEIQFSLLLFGWE
jgi:hypothetical protein